MSLQAAPGWFPDPFRRHDHRYWDGAQWTEHVGSAGEQTIDAPVVSPPPPPATEVSGSLVSKSIVSAPPVDKKVQRQIRKLGVADHTRTGGGTLFTEQILVVNQKAKLFEKKAEYAVFNQQGEKVAGVREFGKSMTSIAVGRENATKRLQIVDAAGLPLLTVTRPATVWKSKVIVARADGDPVGQIVQESLGLMASVLGGRFNVRFAMESDGHTLGSIDAESWRAWDFSVQDPHGTEIARITKTWAGLGKQSFTKADNYVLEMHRPLVDPLLTLVITAALVIDTTLHQGDDQKRR
ncbi:phospholipid scramblase-related protein [Planococcus sp. APC 4015]|nr:phospholipid scramblase-related protein [Planococcus sp. APC 4015]